MKKDYKINDIYAIIVLYNKYYKDSKTFKEISKINGLNIIVADNSTQDLNNYMLSKDNQIKYISMNGNKGLSKAYNQAIKYIENLKGKLICLFDDDTEIPSFYFQELLDCVNKIDGDIYLPVVKDAKGVLSPVFMEKLGAYRVKDINILNDNNISAINSGMCIKSEIYEGYKYNENLFLDYIDHDFTRSMRKQKKRFVIMEKNVLNQDFSVLSDDKDKAKTRYRILKKDLKYFYQDNICYYYFVIFKRKVFMTYLYKSLEVLFW